MTKKHFIALADAVREHNEISAIPGADLLPFSPMHLETIAEFCEEQNPQFNRQRWLDYINGQCGANGGKIK